PFTPFITEEINGYLPGTTGDIMVAAWPHFDDSLVFPEDEKAVEFLMAAIRSIRNIRAEMDVPNAKKTQLFLISSNQEHLSLMAESLHYFQKLASVSTILPISKADIQENYVSAVVDDLEIYINLDELVDKEKEIARLEAEKKKLDQEIDRVTQKLANKGFTDKAPEKVVQIERDKQKKFVETLEKVLERLDYFKK
ncbi:MAG: class I tRNA ligase family protein, partial [Acetobacterium sp.]|nr:class I tRNA ligase family protein [Acetobacterium sp.]